MISRDVAERVETDRADNATLYEIATAFRERKGDSSQHAQFPHRYVHCALGAVVSLQTCAVDHACRQNC